MLIKLLCIGKTQSSYIQTGIDEYAKRISKYCKFEVAIVPDVKNVASLTATQRKAEEGKLLLAEIGPHDLVILLDEKGTAYTSEKFAEQWQSWFNRGPKQIVVMVGGPYGFSDAVYKTAFAKVSLSDMTFSHEMIRLFFTEQLYRSFTIIKNEPYHHR
jgi:23S rRNA (pseudouridine1915-N3)-methyltransferase